jgi:hypothetical protein
VRNRFEKREVACLEASAGAWYVRDLHTDLYAADGRRDTARGKPSRKKP